MCLNEEFYELLNNYILYGSLIVSFIYLGILIIKNIKPKKLKLNIIIAIIFILITNVIRISLIKPCEKIENSNNDKTTIKSTTTTTTTTTKKTTTTTKKDSSYIGKTDKGYTITYKNGAYYIDKYLIVNKTYKLDKNYIPENTNKQIVESMDGFCRECIEKTAYNDWIRMKNDAASLNLNLWIQR